ncbi:hypothetical protein ACFLR7_03035 [Acidobacteriota bacterium]
MERLAEKKNPPCPNEQGGSKFIFQDFGISNIIILKGEANMEESLTIIHQRGTEDNLLVIEVNKNATGDDRQKDEIKIREFKFTCLARSTNSKATQPKLLSITENSSPSGKTQTPTSLKLRMRGREWLSLSNIT